MKKLLVLCTARDRDGALEALQQLGVVHVSPVQPPEGGDLEQARTRLAHLHRALEVLTPDPQAAPTGRTVDEAVDQIWATVLKRKALESERELLIREQARLAPLGSFIPGDLEALRASGIFIRLYLAPARGSVAVPEGATLATLSDGREGRIVALISRRDATLDLPPFRLPGHSLAEVEHRLGEVERELQAVLAQLARDAGDQRLLARHVKDVEDEVLFREVRAGMGLADAVVYLRGYCPADLVGKVQAAGRRHAWAVMVSEPGPDDEVPTLLKNPAWVEPIQSVFKAIGVLPGYREMDISWSFLVFLSLFFAMLVGDAGYGALFFGLTGWARRRAPRAAAGPFTLMYIMSVCTIVWGVLTGTYFGVIRLPAFLSGLKIGWLGSDAHMMLLCFFLGALHLTVAHAWSAWRSRSTLQALAQLGWIGTTWTMFFTARTMVLGETFPPLMLWVAGAAVLIIILFMTPLGSLKAEWFNHVMLPLSLVSNFVDVVSYLRLFAVGSASLAVASSFNDMALGGVHGLLSGLAAALVLFFGHALNVLLSAMGVLVHGVRLNTLEFSSHIGMQWVGQAYRPFQKTPN